MHNGFVNIDNEKMSKSLNNFTTIRALLKHYDPMVVRLFILQAHYRQPIDFTEEAINSAAKAWINIYAEIAFNDYFGAKRGWDLAQVHLDEDFINRFNEAMDDDFNTSVAIALIFELIKNMDKERIAVNNKDPIALNTTDMQQLARYWKTLKYIVDVLGLNINNFKVLIEDNSSVIQQRNQARAEKNFVKSDELREILENKRIRVIDQRGSKPKYEMFIRPLRPVLNFDRSVKFYEVVIKELGIKLCPSDSMEEAVFGFDEDLTVLSIIKTTNNSQNTPIPEVRNFSMNITLRANDKDTVDSFYKVALDNGATSERPPEWGNGQYTCLVLDPDQYKLGVSYEFPPNE